MKNGMDINQPCTDFASCLKTKGIDFVMRYYCADTNNPKLLTQAEAAAMAAANLEIGVIFEDGPPHPTPSYYTNAQGLADGASAWGIAQSLGQPTTSCIYFAIDCDVLTASMHYIIDYFNGVETGMQTAAGAATIYKIGAYGAGAVGQAIKQDNSIAAYSMMALSQGWNGTRTYTGYDINQAAAQSSLCGLTASEWDQDQAQDDFGGFFYQAGQPQAVLGINRRQSAGKAHHGKRNLATR